MEFIKAEEFLKQPIEVQKVFLDWWKPSIGDIFFTENWGIDLVLTYDKKLGILGAKEFYTVENITPLLVEGQLRQFIEDKLESKLDIIYVSKELVENEESYYRIERSYFKDDMNNFWNAETDNLLQAYWQVALELAKEETHE